MNNGEKNYVEKVARQYQAKESTKLDELKRLDQKVNRPALIFAYTFGILGSLILGVGMCIAMKVILKNLFYLGIVIGVVGIIMACINYPLYQKILKARKSKYSKRIVELSNELLNN
ncbi:MAG: dihydropteridine reductase [Roseburia sp.]|nr:hypothetical protein [Anaeroplasma bactoclasticum]MCM1195730.1 dihydropteridine reductase [Roseburia sp.]MCM1556080.1 hypothetical protein [Anaeroplasma bactoclasticum]